LKLTSLNSFSEKNSVLVWERWNVLFQIVVTIPITYFLINIRLKFNCLFRCCCFPLEGFNQPWLIDKNIGSWMDMILFRIFLPARSFWLLNGTFATGCADGKYFLRYRITAYILSHLPIAPQSSRKNISLTIVNFMHENETMSSCLT